MNGLQSKMEKIKTIIELPKLNTSIMYDGWAVSVGTSEKNGSLWIWVNTSSLGVDT